MRRKEGKREMPDAVLDEMENIRELEEEDKIVEQKRIDELMKLEQERLEAELAELVKRKDVEKEKQLRDKQLNEIKEELSKIRKDQSEILRIMRRIYGI